MIRPEDVAEVCATLRAAASDGQPVSATRVVVRRDVLVRAADLLGDLAAEVWLSDADIEGVHPRDVYADALALEAEDAT